MHHHRPLFAELAAISQRVGSTRSRTTKKRLLVDFLGSLERDEIAAAVGWFVEQPRCGPLGVGPAQLWALSELPAAVEPSVHLGEVESALAKALADGPAAVGAAVRELFTAFTEDERAFFRGALTGSLRQGSLGGVMLLALADLSQLGEEAVRRTVMVTGSVTDAAQALFGKEKAEAPPAHIVLFQPLAPMLASTAETLAETGLETNDATLDWKVDGVRAQVHKQGTKVAIYSRSGNDITDECDEITEELAALPASSGVYDGEVVLTGEEGEVRPFQDTFSHLSSKEGRHPKERLRVRLFDCLHRDGVDLLDAPLRDRLTALDATVPEPMRMPRLRTRELAEAQQFFEAARAAGHEGVMVKDLGSTYRAGSRGRSWYKVKAVHTVDLVVLAAEWGSGRRKGSLSNLHLGARREDGTFCMVGKTFKGLTDAMLAWQTEHLLALETSANEHVVHVRPELVVEVRYNDVQRSPRYPGGIALRFARVVRHRPDKAAAEADLLSGLTADAPAAPPKPAAKPKEPRRKKPSAQLSLFDDATARGGSRS
ncbi:MAG: ATP-dependent DNA ligase [Polyangiaceae bacterium]|nr:ATP-dependent DNA ligase [Polyangiaceae bacterium]